MAAEIEANKIAEIVRIAELAENERKRRELAKVEAAKAESEAEANRLTTDLAETDRIKQKLAKAKKTLSKQATSKCPANSVVTGAVSWASEALGVKCKKGAVKLAGAALTFGVGLALF